MREEYERTASFATAIENGIDSTARVVTGVASIMIAVFVTFASSSLATIRNFGVVQAIGVSVDAFVSKLIVIPR